MNAKVGAMPASAVIDTREAIANLLVSTGLITLLEDGLEKASRGLTTIAEVLRMLPRTEKPRLLSAIKRISRSTDV